MAASDRFNNNLRYRDEDHPSQTQLTPPYALDPIREALGGSIGLDPCTTADNPTKALRFYTPPQDGAELAWNAKSIFVNPPYGQARERWVNRCIRAGKEGRKVVLLIPAATDTRIWQRAVDSSNCVVLVRGRLKFGILRPNKRQVAASHASSIIGWNVDLSPCEHLGMLLTWESA